MDHMIIIASSRNTYNSIIEHACELYKNVFLTSLLMANCFREVFHKFKDIVIIVFILTEAHYPSARPWVGFYLIPNKLVIMLVVVSSGIKLYRHG